MTTRKKTLRRMSPTARKLARLANEAESLARKLKNLSNSVSLLEADSHALWNQNKIRSEKQDEGEAFT
jgi:hypothetical protein